MVASGDVFLNFVSIYYVPLLVHIVVLGCLSVKLVTVGVLVVSHVQYFLVVLFTVKVLLHLVVSHELAICLVAIGVFDVLLFEVHRMVLVSGDHRHDHLGHLIKSPLLCLIHSLVAWIGLLSELDLIARRWLSSHYSVFAESREDIEWFVYEEAPFLVEFTIFITFWDLVNVDDFPLLILARLVLLVLFDNMAVIHLFVVLNGEYLGLLIRVSFLLNNELTILVLEHLVPSRIDWLHVSMSTLGC